MSPPADLQTITLPSGKQIQVHTHLFINNEFVPGTSGKTFETINPTNGKPIIAVQEATEADVDKAVAVATECFEKVWKKVAAAERGKLIFKLADLIERDAESLAILEALDNGKSYKIALEGDIVDSVGCYRYFAGWADKIHGKTIETTNDKLCYTRHEPVGVVGAIIPWNYPIMMSAWKLAPALACGNCIVLKTSEYTPLSALKFAELVKEAGFPPGVVNILSGYGSPTGAYLASHPGVSKLAFTGSTLTGRKILESSAKSNLKKIQLELGGKSANIVCADADLDEAVKWTTAGIFNNHGQSCNAGSRIYVHESLAHEFIERFKKEALAIKVGDPFHEETFQGPQISQVQFDKILGYIESGKKEGARVVTGGARWGTVGYFVQPTVFADCKDEMKIMQEEIFGPVVSIATFKTVEEAIERANGTSYGLAGGVFTKDLSTAIRVSNELKAGTVWVNCFDLFDQQSGFGKELGEYALHEYTQVKSVKIKIDP
ncbi:hypothetical protein BC936DRAFT_146743 [Jimgerdemannia flammicorona]|uniref:Aldehyde dehydrogenase domain-containing protein n=1 Tax=Jimgerdemannia flammicorona TaxID=994334 RepID=A0A433D6Y0_9FUNG|nr:hypothetical protein BC936DRAFT_146743 [Jimgerdemannia flammicorona]